MLHPAGLPSGAYDTIHTMQLFECPSQTLHQGTPRTHAKSLGPKARSCKNRLTKSLVLQALPRRWMEIYVKQEEAFGQADKGATLPGTINIRTTW